MSGNQDVKTIWHNGTAVSADIHRGLVRLPRALCSSGLTHEMVMRGRGCAYHEYGHISESKISKSEQPKGALFQILNALEDVRMEAVMAEKHLGCKTTFEWMTDDSNKQIAGRVLESHQNGGEVNALWEGLCAMMFATNGRAPAWKLSDKAQMYFNAAYETFAKVRNCQNMRDCVALAKEVYEILKDALKDWKEQSQEQSGDGEQDDSQEPDDSQEQDDSQENDSGMSDLDDESEQDSEPDNDGSEENESDDESESSDEADGNDEADGDDDSEDGDDDSEDGDEADGDDDSEEGDNEEFDIDNDDSEDSEDDGSDNDGSGDSDTDDDDSEGNPEGSEDGDDDSEDGDADADGEADDSDDLDKELDSDAGDNGADGTSDSVDSADGDDDSDETDSEQAKPSDSEDDDEDDSVTDEELEQELDDDADGISVKDVQNEELAKDLENLDPEDAAYTSRRDYDEHIVPPSHDFQCSQYKEHLDKIATAVTAMTRAMEQALRSMARCRKDPYLRHGKIDRNRLTQIAKGLSKEVFCKTRNGETLEAAVEIIIDESGSMSHNEQYIEVRLLAIAVGEALNQIGVPFEIIGATTKYGGGRLGMPLLDGFSRTNPIIYRHYKSFNEQWVQVRDRITTTSHYMHNVDGEIIEYAAFRLAQRKEARKVILSLSDGRPMAGHGNDDLMARNIIRVCERTRKSGIEVYGFGIRTNEPRQYYGNEWFVGLNNVGSMGVEFTKRFVAILTGGRFRV